MNLRRKTANTPSPVAQAGRRRWNERWMRFRDNERWWILMAFSSLGLAGYFAYDDVTKSQGIHSIPYVVEVDKMGDRRPIGRLDPAGPPTPAAIRGQLEFWVKMMRTVYADQTAQTDNFNAAFKWLDANGSAINVFKEWFFKNLPTRMSAKTYTISVLNETSYYKGGTSWEVDWAEQKRSLTGDPVDLPTYYYAVFSTVVRPPETDAEIEANPNGVFIETLEWGDRHPGEVH